MDASPPPLLTPGQKKLFGFTLSFACIFAVAGLLVALVLVLGRVVATFSNLLWPLALAGILALMLRPVVRAMEEKLRMSPVAAVLTLYGIVLAALLGALSFLIPVAFRQIGDFLQIAPDLAARAADGLRSAFPQWAHLFDDPLGADRLRELVAEFSEQIREGFTAALPALVRAGETMAAVFAAAVGLAIIPVYLFFFLKSRREPTENLAEFLPFLKKETREDVVFLVREFIAIVVSFFRGQLLIALIMGVLLATGFTLAGLKLSIPLGLFLGLLNIVPYLGVIVGLAVTLPTAYFQPDGGWELVLIVTLIFAAVQALESIVLTPKIMGDRTGLHPVTIIIAIFFWGTALGGLLGMILAIPLTAFFVTAWRLAKSKYLNPQE